MHFYIDQLPDGKAALMNDSGCRVHLFDGYREALAACDKWDEMQKMLSREQGSSIDCMPPVEEAA